MIDVVCAVIENEKREILVTQRGCGKSLPGKWEFPGGKIDGQETAKSALILLIGAGLLIQSFRKAINTAPGIDTKNVYALKIGLYYGNYEEPEKLSAFRKQLETANLKIPGIESVAYSSFLPTIDIEKNSTSAYSTQVTSR